MDPQVFTDIKLAQLHAKVADYQNRGWRAVNICGSSVDGQVELIYSFSDNQELENLRLLVSNDDIVPSVSDIYLNTFFFENETHDLFGVNFKGIAIDFGGTFYPTSVPTPMNPASAQAIAAADQDQAAADALPSQPGQADQAAADVQPDQSDQSDQAADASQAQPDQPAGEADNG